MQSSDFKNQIFQLWKTMFIIGHEILLTQLLLRDAEDFPRGGKYLKHVCLSTYFVYLQPNGINL